MNQVAAGSVVLRDLPPQTTAAGVPAKIIGVATEGRPSEEVDQNLMQVLYHRSSGSSTSGNGNGSKKNSRETAKGSSGDRDVNGRESAGEGPRSTSSSVSSRGKGLGLRTIGKAVGTRSFL